MSIKLDDAVIKVKVDTSQAESQLEKMKTSQSKIEKEAEGIKKAEEVKKAENRKERRKGGTGGIFGRVKAGGRFVKGAAFNPMGALRAVPYIGIIVGVLKLLETIILPLVRSIADQAIKDVMPDSIEDTVADAVDSVLGGIQNSITELQAKVVAAGAATGQAMDYAKKANLMTGDLPSLGQMGDFWNGSYGWNQHVYRMSVFGNRAVVGQLGSSIYGSARRAIGFGASQ